MNIVALPQENILLWNLDLKKQLFACDDIGYLRRIFGKTYQKVDSLIHEMPFTRYGQIYLVSLAGTRRLIRSTQNLLPKHFIVISVSYSDSFLVSFSLIISNSETSNQCYMMFCGRFGKLRRIARSDAYVSSVGHFFSGVSFLLSYWSTVGFSMLQFVCYFS